MPRGAMIAFGAASMTIIGAAGAAVSGAFDPTAATTLETPPPTTPPGARRVLTPDESRRAAVAGLLPRDTRSILGVRAAMRYGDFAWDESGVSRGGLLIRVDLRTQLISVFRGGDEIGTAVILYGADGHASPLGSFPILAKLRVHRSARYDAEMPYTLRLTKDGIAIHASPVRWGRATHGCIGVPAGFAARLFDTARVGDPVRIVRSPEPR